ncbi:aminomethyl-transferring glycine dehydrogenase subunit GcvPB [Haloplanus halobius]|uniref:aminomethyl-transferring glycine dehydrogenase subunit GcvPB n=1 Tax=Haloplanus halobius TaxID=2934938 RepID=UPI00200D98A3|nr:aminomethyl-transferring glycine dehydrogenase subunit GcvPB [Haloplanus sp. XH21]
MSQEQREASEESAESAPHEQARWYAGGKYEPLLIEKDSTSVDVESSLPDDLTRDELELPALAEPEVARHYTRLSQMNYGIDSGPIPLGSCTMKYNPKFTEDVAAHRGNRIHPLRSDDDKQGILGLLYELQETLAAIGGMDAVTLQPPAGAAGEFTGIQVAKAYHEANDEGERNEVIVPESAHGTNFASAAMAGYDVVELPSNDEGRVEVEALRAAVGDETALLMLTNPNTLGLFERSIEDIAEIVHGAGGLLYYDGANLNSLLGKARPGDMGFDIMHFNLHKTFATPHGGGGPGQGPIGVGADLAPFLPTPQVREVDGDYETYEPARSIGRVHEFMGNWLVLVKAYAYILRHGDEGLERISERAVLNANYLASQIDYEVPYGPFHHEFVASADADAADVAKGMLDHGVHPPTTKWPEIVDEALMTEPTETESKARLDDLAAAFNAVAEMDPEELAETPAQTTARRIDQAAAARTPRLSWHALDE